MSDANLWWILAALAVGTELLTGTFYLLMVALGLAAGAIAAHVGATETVQMTVAAFVGGGAVAALYRLRPTPPRHLPAHADADVNLDIGQTLTIPHWSKGLHTQAAYRGAQWAVEYIPSEDAPTPTAGLYRIREVVGSTLRVEKA